MKTNESKGITLVALVITIIVMLILAGVSLSMVLDDNNGIIKRSGVSTKAYSDSKEREAIMLAYTAAKFEVLTDAVVESKDAETVNLDLFEQCLKENGNSVIVDEEGNNFLVAFLKTNNVYTVAKDGSILSVSSDNTLTSAADPANFEFNVAGDTITKLSTKGLTINKLVIPETNTNGTPITTIGESAFNNNTSLTKVILSDNIKTIEADAFRDCSSLNQLTISNNLESVVTKTTTFGTGSFTSTPFDNCHNLNKITFNTGLQSIPAHMFENCSNIKEIIIPKSVTSIGENAFKICSNVKIIYTGGSKTDWNNLKSAGIASGNDALKNATNIIYK